MCAAQATWPAEPMICVMCKVSRGRGYTTQPRKSNSVFQSHNRGFLYPLLRLITENEEEISNGLMP